MCLVHYVEIFDMVASRDDIYYLTYILGHKFILYLYLQKECVIQIVLKMLLNKS